MRVRLPLSRDQRIGAGLAVYGAPLAVAFVPGALVVFPLLIAISCFGLWLFIHETLKRHERVDPAAPPTLPPTDGVQISHGTFRNNEIAILRGSGAPPLRVDDTLFDSNQRGIVEASDPSLNRHARRAKKKRGKR